MEDDHEPDLEPDEICLEAWFAGIDRHNGDVSCETGNDADSQA